MLISIRACLTRKHVLKIRSVTSSLVAFESFFSRLKLTHESISRKLMDPEISSHDMARLGKEFGDLEKKIDLIDKRSTILNTLQELEQMEESETRKGVIDPELADIIVSESEEQLSRLNDVETSLIKIMIPSDVADEMSIILEVRAGTGGDEASLFCGEVFRMYEKMSVLKGWKWETLSLAKSLIGGITEATASIKGRDVFKFLKFESGVHRVQRVPTNDTKIQTSAASVIVMPEPGELDVVLRPQDIRVDLYRSQGAGGQSVNTTDSAVRLTHIPSGCVVAIQDERSQIQNKKKAMTILRTRVYDMERERMMRERSDLRSQAKGTGDRSDKIRTYNFPQDRVSDHRIGMTVSGVERVLQGQVLLDIIDKLLLSDEKERLENFVKQNAH